VRVTVTKDLHGSRGSRGLPAGEERDDPLFSVPKPAPFGTSSGTLEQAMLSIRMSSGGHPRTPTASTAARAPDCSPRRHRRPGPSRSRRSAVASKRPNRAFAHPKLGASRRSNSLFPIVRGAGSGTCILSAGPAEMLGLTDPLKRAFNVIAATMPVKVTTGAAAKRRAHFAFGTFR
jgi:hypothetical protein